MERRERSERGGRDDRDSRSERASRDRGDETPRRGGRGDRDSDRSSARGGSGRSSGRSGFNYESRSADSAKKRSEQGGKDYDQYLSDDVKSFKVNDGNNILRIVPPTWDRPEHFGLDVHVHYGIGPDQQAYLCLDKMKGEACPICEERQRAVKDGDDEYAKELDASKRVLYYLVDRDHSKEGIQAWAAPWTIDRDIVKVSIDKRSGEVLPIDHPEDGYDVEFERTGKGMKTKYIGTAIARRSSPLDDDDALQFAVDHPLPTILKYYDYDHIAKVLGGGGGRRSRDDDGDAPRSSERGRDRDRDDRSGGGRREASSSKDEGLSWKQIHSMSYDELCALVDDERLDIDPDKSKSDEDLADWICEEMKIKDEPEDEPSSARDRLSRMRGS